MPFVVCRGPGSEVQQVQQIQRTTILSALLLLSCAGAQQQPERLERRATLQVVESDQEERDLRMTPVVRAVQKAADSVVSIYIQHPVALGANRPANEGQGSGVVLDSNGLVITNWHVVAPVVLDSNGGFKVQARFRDGRTLDARVLSSSPEHDLALLQLRLGPGETVKPIEIGRSADLMIGETVLAIGNPQGHANTVTAGVLSAEGRSIRVRAPDNVVREYSGLLQTDAAINQGNSGGALLDITGKLIGINNAMAVGAENIGFAIPVDTVREVFETELLASDRFVADTWLGFDIAERDGTLIVDTIQASSPAAGAGLRQGDLLLRVGDHKVASRLDYLRQLTSARSGQPLPLVVRRNGRELQLLPTPIPRSQGEILQLTGLLVEELTARDDDALLRRATVAFYQNTPYRRVPLLPALLRVRSVQPDSPAAALNIQAGDVLIGVNLPTRFGDNDFPIESATRFSDLLRDRQGRGLKVLVLRGEEELVGTLDVRRQARHGQR